MGSFVDVDVGGADARGPGELLVTPAIGVNGAVVESCPGLEIGTEGGVEGFDDWVALEDSV